MLQQLTNRFYIAIALLGAPLFALYEWLPFIICKSYGASPVQLVALAAAKPLMALLSFYWSAWASSEPWQLKRNIVLAGAVGGSLALLFWLVHTPWLLVLGFTLYVMASRAVMPAWMELLKLNLCPKGRSEVFARGQLATYLVTLFLPIGLGLFMDRYDEIWRWFFLGAAALHFAAMALQSRFPMARRSQTAVKVPPTPISLTQPWQEAWRLLVARPDFAFYQLIFVFGGLGLMVMHPALPVFFTQVVKISYTEFAVAITVCKAIGFALSNRTWAKRIHSVDIIRLSAYVTLAAAAFPLVLLISPLSLLFAAAAYLIYGSMKSGSDLAWNLSGPIFARSDQSLPFTRVNIVLVGLRGCIGPALGGCLLALGGPVIPLVAGSALCLIGFFYGLGLSRRVKIVSSVS